MPESRTGRLRRFFKEVSVEMQKVTWPTKEELWSSTLVVLVTTAILTVFVGVVDFGMKTLVQLLLGFAGGMG
ncbi:preprotein translocase subunit SecE [Candidatus Sumerlaeota bacterium]|nr:preprotein translocase subunit SecE [Candidatus Sumerlaeota bacterium]